jgi:hypothetical protein
MSNSADQSNFPTMIIPRGTEIRLNNQGQLSIKTPGNLVIQNSGNYSELESTNGSIRIEENVNVEAISVRAGQACYIQGTLTAWRVNAKKISLEDRARANIMLQESETLELSKSSRLVGNFANEKEIYLLLGKFTQQLKQLPSTMDVNQPEVIGDRTNPHGSLPVAPRAETELPEPLRQAVAIIDHEIRRADLDPRTGEILREIAFSIRERDLQRTSIIYREAFGEIASPSDNVRSAYHLIDGYFSAQPRG